MSKISRRGLIKQAGAAGAVVLTPAMLAGGAAAQPSVGVAQAPRPAAPPRASNQPPITYVFFNAAEAAFLEAAVARLIPADDQWPGAHPTGTVGALTYWAADAIKNRYLKSPGPLVPT